MSFNSYGYDPSQDDDIFEQDDLNYPNSDIDDAVKKLHHDMVGNSSATSDSIIDVNDEIDPYVSIIGGFIEFISEYEGSSSTAPAIRSMMYCLNELTNGKAVNLWRIFNLEESIITTRRSLDSAFKASNMTEDIRNEFFDHIKDLNDSKMDKIKSGMQYIIDFMSFRLDMLVQEYKIACEESGHPPNDSILNNQKIDPNLPNWEKKLLAYTVSNLSKVIDDE